MNHSGIKTICIILGMFILTACGSSLTSFLGPVLDINRLISVKIDQFYSATGLEDEYADTGEFAVYIRDAATGQDLACAGQEQGMNILGKTDTYYANLDIPLREVEGEHPDTSARFQLLIVEKDGPDCPAPIAQGDDIIGISPIFSVEDLIGNRIWTSNGYAAALFRINSMPSEEPEAMAYAMSDGLILDRLSFQNGEEGDTDHMYYFFAERYEGEEVVELCEIEDADFANIRYGNISYAALDLPISCFTPDAVDFSNTYLKLSLWIQTENGPEIVGETEVLKISEMIGEALEFTNGKGYVSLRNVATEPFSFRKTRLAEITNLVLDTVSYTIAPAATEDVEVHIRSPKGYSVVCAGLNQGLNISDPDIEYTDLNANFVAVDNQREHFGWDELDLVVVGRSDGLSCPAPLESDFSILGQALNLDPAELMTGSATFAEGGHAKWSYDLTSQ